MHASVPPRFVDKDGNIERDIPNTVPIRSQIVRDGTTKLVCPADAIPPPQITWYKNDVEMRPEEFGDRIVILDAGRELIIYAAQTGDTAHYTCVARNLAGETKKDFDLEVQGELALLFQGLVLVIPAPFSNT